MAALQARETVGAGVESTATASNALHDLGELVERLIHRRVVYGMMMVCGGVGALVPHSPVDATLTV